MTKWTKEMIEEGILEETLGDSRVLLENIGRWVSAVGGMGSGQQVQQEGSKDVERGREGAQKQYRGTEKERDDLEDNHWCALHFAVSWMPGSASRHIS